MKKQELNNLWDRYNIKYEKAQDRGDLREINRLHKIMREIYSQIIAL